MKRINQILKVSEKFKIWWTSNNKIQAKLYDRKIFLELTVKYKSAREIILSKELFYKNQLVKNISTAKLFVKKKVYK